MSNPLSARAFADSCPIPESEPVTMATGLTPTPWALLEAREPCKIYPRWDGANMSMIAGRERFDGDYVFSRYPVLKIHHTVARHTAKKQIVMVRLTPTLTSAIP
jgi:hypothetical protein